jgi:hypothetical protein
VQMSTLIASHYVLGDLPARAAEPGQPEPSKASSTSISGACRSARAAAVFRTAAVHTKT